MFNKTVVLVCFIITGCAHIQCENLDAYSDDPNVQALNLILSVGCAVRDSNSETQSSSVVSEAPKECITWRSGEKMSCEEGKAFDKAKFEESKAQQNRPDSI